MKTIRWGILSTGSIAHKFAKGLGDLPNTELLAVGSRSQESADAFGDEFGIERRYSSYPDLAADPDIDVVYVGTPHTLHCENTLMLLEAGKAVLCEKPFALNVEQAKEMIAAARRHKLFVMEAVWTRFLPHMTKVRELIAEGALGEVRLLQADFGFRMGVDPEHRLFDPEFGGGALLDVGIYPVLLAHELFGPPTEIKSFGNLGETKVDEENAAVLQHAGGELSLLASSLQLDTSQEATITGTEGRLKLHAPWWAPTNLTLYRGEAAESIEVPCPLNGYNYEALEVNRCLREGLLESEIMPLSATLDVLETLDTLRAQWGLHYPAEA